MLLERDHPLDLSGTIRKIKVASATAGLLGDGLIVASLAPADPRLATYLAVSGVLAVGVGLAGWAVLRWGER